MKSTLRLMRNFDLVDIISDLAPWLTPIPSAVLVSNATIRHLGWAEPVGWVSGAIVEMLGISTVSTTILYYQFNQEKRQSDKPLPWGVPATLVFVYLAATIILTVLLDTIPLLAHWSPAIFPILALMGAINLVLRRNYRGITRRIAAEREHMRALRAAAKEAKQLSEFITPKEQKLSVFQGMQDAITAGEGYVPTDFQPDLTPAERLAPSGQLTYDLQGNPVMAYTTNRKPLAERFICSICVLEFRSQNALNAHHRIHKIGANLESESEIRQPERSLELDI